MATQKTLVDRLDDIAKRHADDLRDELQALSEDLEDATNEIETLSEHLEAWTSEDSDSADRADARESVPEAASDLRASLLKIMECLSLNVT